MESCDRVDWRLLHGLCWPHCLRLKCEVNSRFDRALGENLGEVIDDTARVDRWLCLD